MFYLDVQNEACSHAFTRTDMNQNFVNDMQMYSCRLPHKYDNTFYRDCRIDLAFRPQFFYFSFNGSADSIFSILRIKIKVYFSFCIFKFAADSKYLTIQKKKSSRALKIFRSCRQNRLKSGMSDVYAHCVGHCDRKTSIAKLRFRNSDPDKMFRSLPQDAIHSFV